MMTVMGDACMGISSDAGSIPAWSTKRRARALLFFVPAGVEQGGSKRSSEPFAPTWPERRLCRRWGVEHFYKFCKLYSLFYYFMMIV